MHLNIEIKARCKNSDEVRKILMQHNARFIGTDYQEDTYFNVAHGRMKLRLGTIENALIFYKRNDQNGPKASNVTMTEITSGTALKKVLTQALEIKTVVKKSREIYFIENVKFHIDQVEALGSFMEIEAIDKDGTIGKYKLDAQCEHYMQLLNIQHTDLIAQSYSDMLLA